MTGSTGRPFGGVIREVEGPRSGSLEERSALALKILAGIYVAGMILAIIPGSELVATLHTAMFNLAAAVMTGVFLSVAIGLGRRSRWAVAGIRPLLAILVVSGVYATGVAATEGRIKIPWDAGLAIWAAFGPADLKPIPRPVSKSIAMIALVVPMVAIMLFGKQAFGFGGLLDVREASYLGSISVDCGPADAGPPALIRLTYEWTWSAESPMPNGLDIIVVGWSGSDAEGRPMYLFDGAPSSGRGVYPGRREEPSLSVAAIAAAESEGSWQWGVELSEQGFKPGRVELVLKRVRDDLAPGETLDFAASYVHIGLWRRDAAPVTCAW